MDENDLVKDQVASVIMLVVEIILCLGIIWGFHHMIHGVSENTLFWKGYYAKDTALLVDSLDSGTGEAEYVYYLVKPGLDISMELAEDRVVLEDNIAAVEKAERWFPIAIDVMPSSVMSNNVPDVEIVPTIVENPTSVLIKKEMQSDDTLSVSIEVRAQEVPVCQKFNVGRGLGESGALLLVQPGDSELTWLSSSVNSWFRKSDEPVREWNAKVIVRLFYSEGLDNDFVVEFPSTGMVQEQQSLECFVKEAVADKFPRVFNRFDKIVASRDAFDFGRADLRYIDDTVFVNVYVGSRYFWSDPGLEESQVVNMQRAMMLAFTEALEEWSS